MWCNCTPWQRMRSTKSVDLIGHIKFLPWWQLDGWRRDQTLPLFAKGVACKNEITCYQPTRVLTTFVPPPLPPPSPSLDSTQNRYTICGDIFMCIWLMSLSIVCGYSSLWCLGHSTSFASFYLVRIVYKLSLSGFISGCVCCLASGQSGYTKLLTLHTQLCCKLWCNLGRPKYEARVHKNRRSD